MSHGNRRGFTLIELIAGLALAGVVFVSVLALIDQLRDGRDRLLSIARRDNARANGIHVLRSLVASAEVRANDSERFTGDARSMRFASWCNAPGGWLDRCHVALRVDLSNDSAFVRASLFPGDTVVLVAAPERIAFRYFDATPVEPKWNSVWSAETTLPAAVGIVIGADTLIVRAGGRG
ncbi:MAG TPA: prepilin-type N-terminal cleavage/methylation domain-containing protein [Gemmatimonadaceae bacterium]|nr:prepilin-type N-terminal cleavage/methylation domain-containing protein [Gemmatimonadaceae bacterium]